MKKTKKGSFFMKHCVYHTLPALECTALITY